MTYRRVFFKLFKRNVTKHFSDDGLDSCFAGFSIRRWGNLDGMGGGGGGGGGEA